MTHMIRMTALGLAATLLTALPASGAVIDPLDDASGFSAGFGGTTATANGDSTVTLTRNTPNVDAGIDWTDGGAKIPISGHDTLRIIPVGPVDGGYYSVSLLFFDAGDGYLSEVGWFSDSNSTAVQELTDIQTFAGDPNAVSYIVRFRIQPFGQAGASFKYEQIEAVPEPGALSLLALSGLAVLRRGAYRR